MGKYAIRVILIVTEALMWQIKLQCKCHCNVNLDIFVRVYNWCQRFLFFFLALQNCFCKHAKRLKHLFFNYFSSYIHGRNNNLGKKYLFIFWADHHLTSLKSNPDRAKACHLAGHHFSHTCTKILTLTLTLYTLTVQGLASKNRLKESVKYLWILYTR